MRGREVTLPLTEGDFIRLSAGHLGLLLWDFLYYWLWLDMLSGSGAGLGMEEPTPMTGRGGHLNLC